MAGYLTHGVWTPGDPHQVDAAGDFVRAESRFRGRVTRNGGDGYGAEAGRYVLCVSLACPWAHRTLLARALLGLQDAIALWIVEPVSGDDGWVFGEPPEGAPVEGLRAVHQLYTRQHPDYSGLATVPVLWDRKTQGIVNNESAEIVRMLNDAFGPDYASERDLYPTPLRAEIDRVNSLVYEQVNNGVYRCGFARSELAHEAAKQRLFSALDALDARLADQRYLLGDRLTEADLRLFPTLVRFDAVYFRLFRCDRQRIADYPNLAAYARDIYRQPGVAETVDLGQIKRHYYLSHPKLNPGQQVPPDPETDFSKPHDRCRFS